MRAVEGRLRSFRQRKRPSTAGGWYGKGQAHLGRRPPLRMLPQVEEVPSFWAAARPSDRATPLRTGRAKHLYCGRADSDLPRQRPFAGPLRSRLPELSRPAQGDTPPRVFWSSFPPTAVR